jgi:hypothetical protein
VRGQRKRYRPPLGQVPFFKKFLEKSEKTGVHFLHTHFSPFCSARFFRCFSRFRPKKGWYIFAKKCRHHFCRKMKLSPFSRKQGSFFGQKVSKNVPVHLFEPTVPPPYQAYPPLKIGYPGYCLDTQT